MRAKQFVPIVEAQQNLFEVEMSPSSLAKLASAIPGAKVGIEFEMVVPDIEVTDYDDQESEPDYSQDERVDDIDDIIRFFGSEDDYMGEVNGPRELDRLRDELNETFYEYMDEEILNMWKSEEGREYFANWVKENVDPDEVAEFAGTPDDLFGEKHPSKEDYEKFIEDQWDTEGSYYDDAYDAFREEKRDEGDFSERDFLRDIGIQDMSDVASRVRVDISWPFYTHYDGGGGENIESVGDDFSDMIGKTVYTSTDYHGARRSENAYSLEPDSSIDAEGGEAGLEFISPPMPVDEMLEDLEKVKEWAEKRGCYTNRSTGLHINVSVPNYSLENLDFVKLAILLGDKYVLDEFGRYSSQWAKSALDIVKRRAEESPKDADRLLKQVKNGVETIASKLLHSGRTDKYTSINTKDGYVEFRSPGGNWLGDERFNKIKNTILRFVVALDAACDPEKYKKEYLKGLYKVLKPEDPKSGLSLLSRYMAGELNLSDYVNALEKTRTERFREKGIRVLHKDYVEENDWVIEYDDGNKKETLYIANTEAVPDDQAAFNAAKKLKPFWFKPDTVEYITVKPFKFGEELDNLKLYRADYGYKTTAVVAEDEELARKYVKLMDPEYFEVSPNTEITLTDENEASKRKISQMSDWQTPKIEAGYKWIKRPKIWRAVGPSNYEGRYYIAAITRDEAMDIVRKLDPDMAESPRFEIYVSDGDPDQDTYEAYTRAQNDMIQRRERQIERERAAQGFNQAGEDESIDISNLKTYRVSSVNGFKYVVAENGAEASEIAHKLEPNIFPTIEYITAQDQSHLTSTSNPAVIRSMYVSQQTELNRLGQDTPAQQSAPKFEVNDRVEVASGYPSLIGMKGTVLGVSPNFDFVSVQIDGNTTPSSFPTSSLKKVEESTSSSPSSRRISDLSRYMVTNNDGDGSVSLAAYSVDDAIERARAAQPAWADADLDARRLY